MRSVQNDSENFFFFFSFRNFGTDNSVCVYGNRNTTTASQCRGYTESVRVPSYCLIILVVLGMKTVCFFKLSQQPKSSCSSCVYAVWSIARYIIKGQLISKCLFGVFNFFQKTNENKSTRGIIVVKLNSLVRFFWRNVSLKKSFWLCLTFSKIWRVGLTL